MQKGVSIKEKPLCKKSIDSSDVFILDLGLEIFQVSVLWCLNQLTTSLCLVEWQDMQQRWEIQSCSVPTNPQGKSHHSTMLYIKYAAAIVRAWRQG